MARFDPDHLRLGALKSFLGSMTAPDLVSVASYRGTSEALVLTSYGPFSSDGALFVAAVDGLATGTLGPNLMYEGVSEMLSRTVEQAPAGRADPARSLVLVAGERSWPDDTCGTNWTCRHAIRVAITDQNSRRTSRSSRSVAANPRRTLPRAPAASRSRWRHPVQYPVVLENLKSIVARGLGYNRVRIVLDAGAIYGGNVPPVFRSGHTVWATMSVRIAPDTVVSFPVVIPIE